MGIDHLQLSPGLIAALYTESLVDLEDQAPGKKHVRSGSSENAPATAYPYLGRNLRSIIFLTNEPGHDFIPEEKLKFLRKILNACQCSLDDIALINTARSSVSLYELKNQFSPQIIFLWGAVPSLTAETGELPDMAASLVDGITIVPVMQANSMNSENKEGLEIKQRLWACLKKLFSL
jgi:hypothetical protein